MVPAYLAALRQAVQKLGGHEINEIDEKSPTLISFNSFISYPTAEDFSLAAVVEALERRCPDYVAPERWRLCIDDARYFLLAWADQAEALGSFLSAASVATRSNRA